MCCGRQVLLPCSPSRHLSQLPGHCPHLPVDVFLDRGNCQMDLYQSLSSAGCASSVLYHAVFRLIHELWSMLRWITTNRDRSMQVVNHGKLSRSGDLSGGGCWCWAVHADLMQDEIDKQGVRHRLGQPVGDWIRRRPASKVRAASLMHSTSSCRVGRGFLQGALGIPCWCSPGRIPHTSPGSAPDSSARTTARAPARPAMELATPILMRQRRYGCNGYMRQARAPGSARREPAAMAVAGWAPARAAARSTGLLGWQRRCTCWLSAHRPSGRSCAPAASLQGPRPRAAVPPGGLASSATGEHAACLPLQCSVTSSCSRLRSKQQLLLYYLGKTNTTSSYYRRCQTVPGLGIPWHAHVMVNAPPDPGTTSCRGLQPGATTWSAE